MVFSSMTFVSLFFPLVFLLCLAFDSIKAKNTVLLIFSLLFYAWGEPVFVFIMLLTVLTNYVCGLLIDRISRPGVRKLMLVFGLVLSLSFLFFFKYFGFFADTVAALLGTENPFQKPTLPIGLSFYTFQVITYTVDVYRGKVPVQKSYSKLLLYVSFFPQLIAGPIVNYTDIAQSLDHREIRPKDLYQGFMRFFIGFAKKVLLANTCGVITDELLAAGSLSVAGSWLMAIAYAFQIFFDFSGYSDMAIGIGRMFGFHFNENFNYPYISKSVTEFWRRWHISLGTFFRDYVYIPLGGNRVSLWKNIRNIMVVWLLTGFWHGASWNFLVWGVYYGLLLLAEKFLFKNIKEKLPDVVNLAITLLLVLIGWVFFYYESLADGLHHLGTMFGMVKTTLSDPYTVYYFKHYLVFLVAAALACIPWHTKLEALPQKKIVNKVKRWLKPLAVTVLFLMSLCMIVSQSYNPFLYFRF